MCSWFQCPSGNVTKCYQVRVRRETGALTWRVDPVVAQAAWAPPPSAPSTWSALALPPGAFSSLALTPSVLTGNDGRGRSAFIKPKITGGSGGRGGGGPEDTAPLALRQPSLLLPSLRPPPLLLRGCFSDWGRGRSLRAPVASAGL